VPLEDARAAVEHPCGPEVWAGLLTEFAAELQHGQSGPTLPADRREAIEAELDDTGALWRPRPGGRARLRADLEHVARTGRWDRSRYAGRSEARMAVLGSLAARGWRLAEIQALIAGGSWCGLAALYERASEPGRMERLLPAEWRKTVDEISREKNVRHRHTSDVSTRPPTGRSGVHGKPRTGDTWFLTSADEYGLIRMWMTAILCALDDPERIRGWGRRAIAVRLVLLALGQAAMVSGSSTIEFGCRQLALHSCLSHRTVARVLRMLAAENDPLIDLVSARQMVRADRYALRIPGRYADSVRWRRRRAGRIEAAHHVFLKLGGVAALVYQVLPGWIGAGTGRTSSNRGAEIARAARLSASATSAALRVLAEHGLAERGPGGWRRGPACLDDVAESTGAADLQREREARYRKDRESWRARLRQYQGVQRVPVIATDGWWSIDDDGDWEAMLFSRWPVLAEDPVRGPPSAEGREIA
jgi:hypothetical protein